MSEPSGSQSPSMEAKNEAAATTRVAFRFHARALAALGRDLVTSDVVAVMELVKNAYDALATRVEVHIRSDDEDSNGPYIEIADDGHGMDHDTIVNVWCVVATPFRQDHPVSKTDRRSRPVTGEKGLGRLSAARLGAELRVITRTHGGPVLEFSLNWDEMLTADDPADVAFDLSRLPADAFDGEYGTRIRIGALRSTWDAAKTDELRESLARLISPFATAEDFWLGLYTTGDGKESVPQIKAPEFMSEPKYEIGGRVTDDATIQAKYRYRPTGQPVGREREFHQDWSNTVESLSRSDKARLDTSRPDCGPFQFEIRAWDLNKDDTRDIAEHFGENRARVRGAIASHQGISVYRDDVLVLPKSTGTRDWLGLDLRRVSRVGSRLSTSQLVGYVRITKADNPRIEDTSDREGLASNPATDAFRCLVMRIVNLLEIERHSDRLKEADKGTAKDLFANLSVDPLVANLEELRNSGGNLGDAVQIVKAFGHELERSRTVIETRFGYYNRLAVIGTIAEMVIHEIRNRTTVIGRGLRKAGELAHRVRDAVVGQAVAMAKGSVTSLEELADRFAPLASRGYRPGRHTSVVEESIRRCLAMQERETRAGRVVVEAPEGTDTKVRIDPGEIDAIILNLLANSLYWLRRHDGERHLRFRVEPDFISGRVTIFVDDSGPGINPDDRERVFWPGVTLKPGGIGMGLTVAAELVDGHGGRMGTKVPGELGGATFEFDLPLARKGTEEMRS